MGACARASALSQEDIISYRKLYILIVLWSYPRRYDLIQKFIVCMVLTILSHTEIYCLYGLVPRRYYLIQKTINTNSFMVLSQEDIIS